MLHRFNTLGNTYSRSTAAVAYNRAVVAAPPRRTAAWTRRDSSERSDLWSPEMRRWMTDFHSPVRRLYDEPRRGFRGSGIIVATTRGPALLLENGSYLLLEDGVSRLLLE